MIDEQLKKAVVSVCKLGMDIEKHYNDDNKISLGEAGVIAVENMHGIISIARNAGEIAEQIKEVDKDELKVLIENELELQNENLEEIIEKGISLIVDIYNFSMLFSK
jgi:hypothetical protein